MKNKILMSLSILLGILIVNQYINNEKWSTYQGIDATYIKSELKSNQNELVKVELLPEPEKLEDKMDIKDEGIIQGEYIISVGQANAKLSRDGSPSVSVKSGMRVTKPGTYFLTILNEQEETSIVKWVIEDESWQEHWAIQEEEELEEILKSALQNFKQSFEIQFNYGTFKIDEVNNVLFQMIEKLLNQYPKLTFESYVVTGKSGLNPTVQLEITYPLEQTAELQLYDRQVDQKIITILENELNSTMTDYEKEWALYRYIIENVVYSAQVIEGEKVVMDTPMTHTLYGALMDYSAVCDGYAKSLMYLLNIVGINTELVSGEAGKIAHVWNKVVIQGEKYHVDATWGDLEDNQIGGFYNYFNEIDSYMEKTHVWKKEEGTVKGEEIYNTVYLPIELSSVYRIYDNQEWKDFIKNIKRTSIDEGSIIFYNVDTSEWDEREIIGELCLGLEKSLEYNIIEKYNTLIINYRVYEE